MTIGRQIKHSDLIKLTNENFTKLLQHLEGRLSQIIEEALFIRYEFVLLVQTRNAFRTLYKIIQRPSMPLICDNICIDNGYYKVNKINVDMDERSIRVCLHPQIINRNDVDKENQAFKQFVDELLEAGWNE